jgi:hypothetical protein
MRKFLLIAAFAAPFVVNAVARADETAEKTTKTKKSKKSKKDGSSTTKTEKTEKTEKTTDAPPPAAQ